MPPKRCPIRLQRLIDRANESDKPHALRLILRALRDRRQNKGPDTFAVDFLSRVTIDLTDYTVTVHNELERGLKEIDPPDNIDLIRECPVCKRLFWAGRAEKQACDRHAERWRKRNQRLRQKEDRERAEQQATERQDARRRDVLKRLSPTATAILNAIVLGKQHVFHRIDNWAWAELNDNPSIKRVPERHIVRQSITMLVDRGYLTHDPRDNPLHDRYFAKQRLIDDWIEIRRGRAPPAH